MFKKLQKIIEIGCRRRNRFSQPANLATFWRKLNFWAPNKAFLDALGAQAWYDVMWSFTPIYIFS